MAHFPIRGLVAAATLACAQVALQPALAQERPPLRICMAEGNSPLSHRESKEPRGLDVAIGQAIASEMGRTLSVVFFESEYERETTLSQEVNALLSSGVCSLASGYALFVSDLGVPSRPNARTPEHDGGKPRRQRPFVELGKLAATRAYHAMAMGVVTRDSSVRADTLADLQGVRVGAVTGTLAGSALAMYRNGLLLKGLVTLSQRENLLAALEAGRFDATLTPLNRYDAYRLAHPATPLARAKYVHPLRINLGFVGLERDAEVLGAADRVIERALASGELERWAASAGATWVRPVAPDINPPFSFGSLRD